MSVIEPPSVGQGTSAPFIGTGPDKSASKTYAIRYRAEQALGATDVVTVASAITYNIKYH